MADADCPEGDLAGDIAAAGEGARRRILYGRRLGHRLRPVQKALLSTLLPQIAIPASGALDPAELFPKAHSCALEIGFGGGEHLAALARQRPDRGFIGAEAYLTGVVQMLGHVKAHALSNVRVFQGDARDVLDRLRPDTLEAVYLLFPDPWPKTRHHKRRFVQEATLSLLARVLKPQGMLKAASDDPGLARWMADHFARHPDFEIVLDAMGANRPPAEEWPLTRYELKAAKQGRPARYFIVRRRGP